MIIYCRNRSDLASHFNDRQRNPAEAARLRRARNGSSGRASGYDIKKSVRDSIRFFWTISEAQIYPSLDRLERAALVRGRAAPQGRRRRRNFDITPQGEAALRGWLTGGEAMPFELRDIGLVKLFFADALDRADALALLQAVIERSRERVAALNRIEPKAGASGRGYPSPGVDIEPGYRLPQGHHRRVRKVRERAGQSNNP